jgi:hypothetical protein
MKQADEMGSGAMMHMPSFIKIGSDIQQLSGWVGEHTLSRRSSPFF